jgi:hypothetical protein
MTFAVFHKLFPLRVGTLVASSAAVASSFISFNNAAFSSYAPKSRKKCDQAREN